MSTAATQRSAARPRIVIAAREHAVLTTLAEKSLAQNAQIGEYLSDELSRAFIVPDDSCAANVVRMGSAVTYRDHATARIRKVTLVYPHEADANQQRISVLTPIGAALIGLSIAQTIEWPSPDGDMRSLTVLDVDNEQAPRLSG
jgi:regulator of nucleoside diphosphate kinase